MLKRVFPLCTVCSLFFAIIAFASPEKSGSYLVSDGFEIPDTSWNEVALLEESDGDYEISDGKLIMNTRSGPFGVFNNQSFSGHFIIEAQFQADHNIGLLLIQEKDGKPDVQNYTVLCVDKNSDGHVVVSVKDCQNGAYNILDNTGKTRFNKRETDGNDDAEINLGPDLYEHVLTGDQYSVPFDQTDKKIRIFRDANSGFFHYYYGVRKIIHGKEVANWMELRPSKDWAKSGTSYFVGLVGLHAGETIFTQVNAQQKPMADQDDSQTGFKITKRDYNWSGFFENAFVVTFDKAFPHHDRDIKFVFWEEMNFIPAWHLNNQLLYTYEFVETWDDDTPGCHEPMSDRLHRWSRVNVLEDNPVRKVIQWHYVLCNPDYQIPADGRGSQLPEVDEYWTFYPDGSGTRHIVYTPKLDTDFRNAHELGEFISIAGSKSHSSDFYGIPALTMMNLEDTVKQAHPGPKFDYYSEMDDWNQQILTVHFKEDPDVFCVWSVDPDIPDTYSGYKIRYENAWQNPNIKCVHWPVNKRPYTSAYSSGGTWKAEVSHACLLSWGVRDGIEWKDHYKVDKRGRKYREWVSLVGVNDPGDRQYLEDKARSWLFPGKITAQKGVFDKIDYRQKAFIFTMTPELESCTFSLNPVDKSSKVINPAIQLTKCSGDVNSIRINGIDIPRKSYRVAREDENTIVWIQTVLEGNTEIDIGLVD